MESFMPKGLLILLQCASIVLAYFLSRVVALWVVQSMSRPAGEKPHLLTTPMGSALVFGATFVVLWTLISLAFVFGWFAFRPGSR
jgi:hypothetical protein